MLQTDPNRILRAPLTSAMVQATLRGQKNTTRRLASSPLARAEPGDLIWVQEALEIDTRPGPAGLLRIRYAADGMFDWREVPWPERLARPTGTFRLARFMPRELSRITLLVRRTRFHRLRDMVEADATAEGIVHVQGQGPARWWVPGVTGQHPSACEAFAELWDNLHKEEGARWSDNPEVVAVTYDRLGPIDTLLPGLGHGGVRR